ncbi:MAG: PhzF family phenazine biosynthesis protein [Cyclobacteriaceae bacterium]|nr:PhzF family phenazine biosynthesis protein [Cyclobacteriaceae bacterium]
MYKGKTDYLAVLDSEEKVRDLQPNLSLLSKIEARGIIVTAKGKTVDFVSRFFAPQLGIDEDPVTGSAHTTLIPYWSARLGKEIMRAKQLSARGGDLYCRMAGERVVIGGKARLYMVGEIGVVIPKL